MNWGYVAYVALMAALVIAYLQGVRSYGLSFKRMAKIAAIWAVIIIGGYFIVSRVFGIN